MSFFVLSQVLQRSIDVFEDFLEKGTEHVLQCGTFEVRRGVKLFKQALQTEFWSFVERNWLQ